MSIVRVNFNGLRELSAVRNLEDVQISITGYRHLRDIWRIYIKRHFGSSLVTNPPIGVALDLSPSQSFSSASFLTSFFWRPLSSPWYYKLER